MDDCGASKMFLQYFWKFRRSFLKFLFDLEELHRLIRLGVAGFGLQGLNGGLAAPVAIQEGDHGEAASRPYNKIQRKNEIE